MNITFYNEFVTNKDFNVEGLTQIKITGYNNQLRIDKVFNKDKGAFKRFWNNELIPFCKENYIPIITLVDRQITDRDVWGEDYGFSGNKRSGKRVVYIGYEGDSAITSRAMNTLIEMTAHDMIDGVYDEEDTYDYGMRKLKLSNEEVYTCIKYAEMCFVAREDKGNMLFTLSNLE